MGADNGSIEALAVYGTLAPGEPNHWVISRIQGEWTTATTRGYVFEITWGPAEGYQGFIASDAGNPVPVAVLESAQLSKKWRDIDEFEGAGYERVLVPITLESGDTRDAWIYTALTEA